MGFLKRKPRPGDAIRYVDKRTGSEFYGLMASADAVAYVGTDGEVRESDLTVLGYGGRVEQVADAEVPRREFRKLMRYLGVTPAEESLGPATEDELDRRWDLMQRTSNQ